MLSPACEGVRFEEVVRSGDRLYFRFGEKGAHFPRSPSPDRQGLIASRDLFLVVKEPRARKPRHVFKCVFVGQEHARVVNVASGQIRGRGGRGLRWVPAVRAR